MPCCKIPNQTPPVFPFSLIPDAVRFANYVGGAPFVVIGAPAPTTILNSGLHLEMKLWPVEGGLPLNRYLINGHFHNAWVAMLAGWLDWQAGDRFDVGEKPALETLLDSLPNPTNAAGCHLTAFDGWHLQLMSDLRQTGQNLARNPILPEGKKRTTALASFGRCQKLINVFLKYEICWQVADQWVGRALVPYAAPRVPSLPEYLCALHAPIDRILLAGPPKKKGKPRSHFGLSGTPLGQWLKGLGMMSADGADLRQSSDGEFQPWSKLDCLRAYYGFQLMLRRIALNTWPPGCACGSTPPRDPATSAKVLTGQCRDWFNAGFCAKHPVGEGPDWIQIACDLPEEVIRETILKLRIPSPG